MLMAGLCATQFLGASIGFVSAERVAFREKKPDQLQIASLLTFPVAFFGGFIERVDVRPCFDVVVPSVSLVNNRSNNCSSFGFSILDYR